MHRNVVSPVIIQFHSTPTTAAPKMPVKIILICYYSWLISETLGAVLSSQKYARNSDISSQKTMICHSTKVMTSKSQLQCAFQCAARAICYGIIYINTVTGNGSCIVCGKCSTTTDSQIIFIRQLQSLQSTELFPTGT